MNIEKWNWADTKGMNKLVKEAEEYSQKRGKWPKSLKK
jgi:hypothetical protein